MEKSKKINRKKGVQWFNGFVLRGRVKGDVEKFYREDESSPLGKCLDKVRFRLEWKDGGVMKSMMIETENRLYMIPVTWECFSKEMIEVAGWLDVMKVEFPGGMVEVPVLKVMSILPESVYSKRKGSNIGSR